MSHSTHVGFNEPPPVPWSTIVATDRELVVPDPDRFGPFQSDAIGVGILATAVARSSPPDASRPALAKSGPDGDAFGVGQRPSFRFTAVRRRLGRQVVDDFREPLDERSDPSPPRLSVFSVVSSGTRSPPRSGSATSSAPPPPPLRTGSPPRLHPFR